MATTPAADFSQPIYMEETPNSAAGSAALTDVSVVDLNDPALLNQEFESNAQIDAYAAPPPVPDGMYKVKIKQIDVKRADGTPGRYAVKADPTKNKGIPYAYTAIEASIVDPSGKYDNVKVWDRFVSTMTARNGGVPIVTILTALGHKVPAKVNATQLLEMFFKATASEPELMIETVWEGSFDEADRDQMKTEKIYPPTGMHRFPQATGADGQPIAGVHVPDMDVDTKVGKKHVRAQVRINGYHPVKK